MEIQMRVASGEDGNSRKLKILKKENKAATKDKLLHTSGTNNLWQWETLKQTQLHISTDQRVLQMQREYEHGTCMDARESWTLLLVLPQVHDNENTFKLTQQAVLTMVKRGK